MTLVPQFDNVLVSSPEIQKQTVSGIYIPETKADNGDVKIGTILEIGKDCKNFQKGQKVVYKQYSANKIKLDDTEYMIVKEEHILAVVAA